MTSFRLPLVIGFGAIRTAFTSTPLAPELNLPTFGMSVLALPSAIMLANSAAALPSTRESFQTDTSWVPSATRFRAALSPSWPVTGTVPARPWASRAATTPPAMPSFSEITASTLLFTEVRHCSMFFWAASGFQPSVKVSQTFLILPASMLGFRTSMMPWNRNVAFGSPLSPLMKAKLPSWRPFSSMVEAIRRPTPTLSKVT